MPKPNYDARINFNPATTQVAYRFDDGMDGNVVKAILTRYYIIRETPKGYWVVNVNTCHGLKCLGGYQPWWIARKTKHVRWIARNAARSYCNLDYNAALLSYQRRKEMQIWHATLAIQTARLALANLDTIANLINAGQPYQVDIGRIDAQASIHWE